MNFPLSLEALVQNQENSNFDFKRYRKACIDRIESLDCELGAVISINSDEPSSAVHGPFSGIPVLVKDNIETRDPLPTTAGSLALVNNVTLRDASCISNLRAVGMHILGKTNLTEWANFRSKRGISGWSAVGGQTHNPFRLGYSPCGSSSGSAVAVAVGMAPAAVGSETIGSIVCPAATTGVVGLKPTRGLIDTDGIIPISHALDTPGPITRTVTDAGILLGLLSRKRFLLEGRQTSQLRIGVLTPAPDYSKEILAKLERVLTTVEKEGGLVERGISYASDYENKAAGYSLMKHSFRTDLEKYFSSLNNDCCDLTLEKLVAFNEEHSDRELAYFGHEIFTDILSSPLLGSSELYAREQRVISDSAHAIDSLLKEHFVDVLIGFTNAPAWEIDYSTGDGPLFTADVADHPAIAGYPHLTLPFDSMDGFPIGLSVIGSQGRDKLVLETGVAIENIIDFHPWQVFD